MTEGTSALPGVVNLSDLEGRVEADLEPAAFAYYAGGAADERTLRDNVEAWGRRRFRPRVLVDVSAVDPATRVLGTDVALPIGVAPTALHGLGHPDGAELDSARAAARAGVLFTMSSLASRPMEDLAGLSGPRWFQLYAHRDRAITDDVVARAGAAGFGAIVLTVDLPVVGHREREVRGGFGWPGTSSYGNFARYAGDEPMTLAIADQLTWDDVERLRGLTELPVVVKGILTAEDAELACSSGAAGVWVSNHGGRQLDRAPASVDVLEEVVQAVGGRAEVYVDSGVRRGSDALVALALGATAAFVGRPVLYSLALGGEDGVVAAFDMLREELVNAMALLGVTRIDQVTRAHLA